MTTIPEKIQELRNQMKLMDTDFDGMQSLQAKIEVLKELINDETDTEIEDNWFDAYGEHLKESIKSKSIPENEREYFTVKLK